MSIQLFLFDKFLRFQMKRRFKRHPDALRLRPMMVQMARVPARLPPGVRIDQVELGGVPVERVTPAGADLSRALIYVHGGGFVAGLPRGYRSMTGRFAHALGVPVYVPEYRLAPEHPFPAGLDDVVAVHGALLARGVAPGHIAIAGDSAGGNLTLATALRLKQAGTPMPCALVALSPVTDQPGSFPSRTANAESDAVFDPRTFATVIPQYCPGTDPGHPMISPYRADLRGLPPTLLHCSEVEMLRDDSIEMAERLRAAVVSTKLEVWPGVPHVWHLAADFLPEARRAIDGIVAFLRPLLLA